MSYQNATKENLVRLIENIKQRLRLVNSSLIRPENFTLEHYAEIKEIYEMMEKKQRLTPMEIEGILEELKSLRN